LDSHLILPPNLQVIERGWLSANQVYLWSDSFLDVIDSGFCSHQAQTVELLKLRVQSLTDISPRFLINTHLHSDHCGGNAALIHDFNFRLLVPSAEFDAVQDWDEHQLGFSELGQPCPEFNAFGTYEPNTLMTLGNLDWEIHQAPGHEDQAQLLFNPEYQILISGDALWEKGFGALFPMQHGLPNFEGAFLTLELIAQLQPKIVIPGHGSIFQQVSPAIHFAQERLNYLSKNPERNLIHVVNVLLKFKILEWQECHLDDALMWFENTPMLIKIAHSLQQPISDLFELSINSLVKSKAIAIRNQSLFNL
jgi:glyoxylase-like metal-dependent hydrolase (beta-lactamase superfamily II)